MFRWYLMCIFFAWLLCGCTSLAVPAPVHAAHASTGAANPLAACAVTPPLYGQPPNDPHADPFGFGPWQVNTGRTIWVNLPHDHVWHTGGEKAIWIRPAGTELRVSGQRLDANAAPLRVDQPCCYPTGFQVNALHFPTAGCWQITATAGDHTLQFIVEVEDSSPQTHTPASPWATYLPLQRCTGRGCELQWVDATTGAIYKDATLALGRYATFGLANGLAHLALITYTNNSTLEGSMLSFIDLATLEQRRTTLTFDGATSTLHFAPDDTRLLIVTQVGSGPDTANQIYLVDVNAGTVIAEEQVDFYPVDYRFAGDGRSILFFGTRERMDAPEQGSISLVARLDATKLEVEWHATVEGLANGQTHPGGSNNLGAWTVWQPALAFAPDDAKLYIVHADRDALTTVDYATQWITTHTIMDQRAWFESWVEQLLMLTARPAHAKMAHGITKQAVVAPDGSSLYVVGTFYRVEGTESSPQFVQEPLGLQVIDPATGRRRASIVTGAQAVSLEPTFGWLLLHGWATDQQEPFTQEWTTILDTATLAEITQIDKAVTSTRRLDGTPWLLATRTLSTGRVELSLIDPQDFASTPVSAAFHASYANWLVLR